MNANLGEGRLEEYQLPMLEIRQMMADISSERLAMAQDKAAREAAVTPEMKDKRKWVASATTKIDNAKIDVDALLRQGRPSDPDEANKWSDKLKDAFTTELALVRMKRQKAGGKAPTTMEYLKERFPDSANQFAPFFPGMKGNIGFRPENNPKTKGGVKGGGVKGGWRKVNGVWVKG